MEDNKQTPNDGEYIDLLELIAKLWQKKLFFFILWLVTFVVACALVLPIPRQYKSTVRIAPESNSNTGVGALGSLASTFGINLNAMQSTDALGPDLYPDIVATNNFIVALMDVPVCVEDDDEVLNISYGSYMQKHQKITYYQWPKNQIKKWIRSLQKSSGGTGGTINPNRLSLEQDLLVQFIRSKISCMVDKKTGVVSLTVWDQHPEVAAAMADTIQNRLQKEIIDYRTKKARIDEAYYRKLMMDALSEYQNADKEFTHFCESNWDITSPTISSKKEQLANTRSLALSTYNALVSQHQMAIAKVQENTPAFTTLERPNVATKAEKPKRMLFVLAMLVLATVISVVCIFYKEIKSNLA